MMFHKPLYKFIIELKPKKFRNQSVHNIKVIEGKLYCKFQEKRSHKTDECRELKYYLEELKMNDFLDKYLNLEKDDL